MRILNRPMFRYGGPIKEGVMHGMRDGGRAALVGNPVYPRTGGREHHQINLQDPRKGAVKKGGIWLASKVPGFTKGWAKRMWDKYKFPSKLQPTGINIHPYRQVPKMERAGQYFKKHPYISTLGPAYAAFTEPVQKSVKGIANFIPEVAQFGAEVFTPKSLEKYLPPDKWWKWGGEKWTPGDVRGEEGGDGTGTKTKPIGAGAQFEDTAPILTASQREKLAKDQRNARLKNYLEMMGYDSAKKTALSDALIDASALVQDATTEAGSIKHADWGNLINRAIQTTSKRLDKPEQIREAVGLMATKAEIEKDIFKEKGGALKQNARDLVAAGVYKTEKEALAHLGKKAGFEEVVGALAAKKKVDGSVLAEAWRISGKGIPKAHVKGGDDLYKNFKEKVEDAGGIADIELEFVKKEIPDRKAGEVYVIDDRLIIIQKDGTPKYRW